MTGSEVHEFINIIRGALVNRTGAEIIPFEPEPVSTGVVKIYDEVQPSERRCGHDGRGACNDIVCG